MDPSHKHTNEQNIQNLAKHLVPSNTSPKLSYTSDTPYTAGRSHVPPTIENLESDNKPKTRDELAILSSTMIQVLCNEWDPLDKTLCTFFCFELLEQIELYFKTTIKEEIVYFGLKYFQRFLVSNKNNNVIDVSKTDKLSLFTVSLGLAFKYLVDIQSRVFEWSVAASMKLEDLVWLEKEILKDIDFSLNITDTEYLAWIGDCLTVCSGNISTDEWQKQLAETADLHHVTGLHNPVGLNNVENLYSDFTDWPNTPSEGGSNTLLTVYLRPVPYFYTLIHIGQCLDPIFNPVSEIDDIITSCLL